MEIMDAEQKREKRLKTIEESLRELWDNVKHTNICIIGVPEGEERERGTEKIFQEIIAKNFPHMGKEPGPTVSGARRTPRLMMMPFLVSPAPWVKGRYWRAANLDRKSTRLNSSH